MEKFVVAYIASSMALTTGYLAWYISPFYVLLISIPISMVWAVLVWRRTQDVKDIAVDGLYLGDGLDIENPEKPKKIKVYLDLMLGFLAIGGPGSGKSIFSIVVLHFYAVVKKVGWVYWDGKGDLDIYQKTVASGAKPDYFFSSELPGTDTVNLIPGPASGVIEAMTQALISKENQFYETNQREAIGAIVPLLKATGKKVILRDVYVAIKFDEAIKYAIKLAREHHADRAIIAVAEDYISTSKADRDVCVKGLLTKMSLFVTGEIADRLNAYNPTLDLTEASKNGKRVYMHLPYTRLAKDIAIFFTETIGIIAKNRQLYDKCRVLYPMVFDDWGKFFYDNIGSITARCRSAGIPVNYLFQSRGQTDAVDYAKIFTVEMTDNIGGLYIFRPNGRETAEWAAEQFGSFDSKEITKDGEIRSEEKSRVRADQMKNLDAGEAFMDTLISGEHGRSANKRIRVRVPYPDMAANHKDIDWPVIASNPVGDQQLNLNLWEQFMDAEKMKELQRQLKEEAMRKIRSIDHSEEIEHL